jgi:hypothetical protein
VSAVLPRPVRHPALPRRGPSSDARFGWRTALPDAFAAALLLVLPWLYYWRLFTPYPPDQMTLAEGDFNVEFFPLARAVASIVRGGELPLWNPWSDSGQPLLADPQTAVWYPLNWVLPWLVHGNDGQSLVAYEAHTVFHYFLISVSMYLLARHTIGSRLGALVAALTFAYSGLMTSYPMQQVPILRTAVWMPLLLLCLIRAFDGRSIRWAVAAAVLLAVDIAAGHPQLLLFQAYGLTVYLAYRVWQAWPRRRAAATMVGLYTLFGVLGLCLAAIQLVPTYEFMRISDRASADYKFTAVGFSPFEFLLDAVAPRVIGGLPPYIGILPLLLAFLAVRFVRDRFLPFCVLVAAFGLLVSFGGNTFFHSLLYLLAPGFALFQHQERAIYLYVLGMALLAGYGTAWLAGPLRRAQRVQLARLGTLAAAGLLAALVVAGVWYAGNLLMEGTPRAYRWRDVIGWYNWFVFMLLVALGVLALRVLWRRGRRLLLAAIPAAIALDLFTVSWNHDLAPLGPNQLFVPSQIVRFLQAEPDVFRVADYTVLNGNHGLVYLLPTIDGTFGMFVGRFTELRHAVPPNRLFELLNVKYILTRQPAPEGGEIVFTEPFQDHLNHVVRVPSQLARATVVPRARVIAGERELLATLASPGFDPRAEILLADPGGETATPGTGRAVVRGQTANTLDVEVEATGGYLLLSEIYYPGWRAQVDGAERTILRANHALRAIPLQPTDRHVRMIYDPGSLRFGALVSVYAALVATLLMLLPAQRRWQVLTRRFD